MDNSSTVPEEKTLDSNSSLSEIVDFKDNEDIGNSHPIPHQLPPLFQICHPTAPYHR